MMEQKSPTRTESHACTESAQGSDRKIGRLRLILAIAVGVFLGSGLFTFSAGKGHSYLSDNPQGCVNCHIMRPELESWQKSSHHAAAVCNDCHLSQHPIGQWVTKADNGLRHSWAFTFQNFHEPIQLHPRGVAVLHNNCLRCHETAVSQITAHTTAARDPGSCVRCHQGVGHGAAW